MYFYSHTAGCGEVLLKMLPVYASAALDTDSVKKAASEGIYSVWCEENTIYATDKNAEITPASGGTVRRCKRIKAVLSKPKYRIRNMCGHGRLSAVPVFYAGCAWNTRKKHNGAQMAVSILSTGGAEGKIDGEKQQQYGGKSTGYYKQQQLIPFKRTDIALGGHLTSKRRLFIGTTQSRFGLAVGRINGGFGVGRLVVLKWLAGEHIVK